MVANLIFGIILTIDISFTPSGQSVGLPLFILLYLVGTTGWRGSFYCHSNNTER